MTPATIAVVLAVVAIAGAADALAASAGGASFVATPRIRAVRCVTSCLSRGRVQTGGRIRLRGAELGDVRRVIYRGGPGRRDDVAVRVRKAGDSSISVRVPMRAQSGAVDAWVNKRLHARSRKAVTIMPPAAPIPNRRLSRVPGRADAGAPSLETATSRSLFAIDQRGGVKFSYRVGGQAPARLELQLVRLDDGVVVRSWTPSSPAPGKVGSIAWNGLSGKKSARLGRYAFRLAATSSSGAKAVNANSGDLRRDAFELRPALFPIKGRHSYGGAGNRFGAPRSGHTHQGQDVMARCGTPLVAARGGVVKARQYQSAAGYYIVIDGQGTGVDYAYMHLAAPSAYATGDRVRTGDQVGVVGDTGDATACHLHFEEWRSPGWYTGGSPFDPLADLRAWDAYS